MSHDYQRVQWTPFKRQYDRWMLLGMLLYLAVFIAVSFVATQGGTPNPVQVLIRAFGSLAFLMLTFVLCLGPMARLTPRFKPLMYNRRHLGVATFSVAFVHAVLVVFWYHGFGDLNPLVSVLVSNPRYDSIAGFPFESLGLVALLILFLMASTSHDFWNANLGLGVWKFLHMGVYLAFVALVAHVVLGVIQFEKHPLYVAILIGAAAVVAVLHLITGFKYFGESHPSANEGWLSVGSTQSFESGAARIVRPKHGEAIAVFFHDGAFYGVSNVCRHQGGPLGEGRVVDGCITCPWHGFQYQLQDGRSPAPFTEKIATYATRIEGDVVLVRTTPNPPGTEQAPANLKVTA
ncbi:MAG: ferric reductase-like transmembrane domain-containing protein [Pseudomonadota bacterium]